MKVTFELDPTYLPSLEEERKAYNSSLPVPDGSPPSSGPELNPKYATDVAALLRFKVEELAETALRKYARVPVSPIVNGVPQRVKRAPARKAMILNNMPPPAVYAKIDLIADPVQKELAKNAFENDEYYERTNETLLALWSMFAADDPVYYTDARLDAMFVQAYEFERS